MISDNNPVYPYRVQDEVGNDAFNDLKKTAVGFTTSAAWFSYLKASEIEYMNHFHAVLDTYSMDKNGEWKFNRYQVPSPLEDVLKDNSLRYRKQDNGKLSVEGLPSSYRTAKSVIGYAIDEGVPYETMGKTEIEKTKAGTAQLTPEEKVDRAVSVIRREWDALSQEKRDDVTVIINNL